MIALLQRAVEARVEVDGRAVAAIGPGILALVGFHKNDAPAQTGRMAERILGYRLFADAEGKMNHSLAETGGALLLEELCAECRGRHGPVETGEFAIHPRCGDRPRDARKFQFCRAAGDFLAARGLAEMTQRHRGSGLVFRPAGRM